MHTWKDLKLSDQSGTSTVLLQLHRKKCFILCSSSLLLEVKDSHSSWISLATKLSKYAVSASLSLPFSQCSTPYL
jgi:UDP-N-acetylglucosamine transferase subunit ALG13